MSSISWINGLLKNGLDNGVFQSQTQSSMKRARGDARGATASDLTRSLLANAAALSGGNLPSGTTAGANNNPLTANLGNLIDLRASLVKATEDTSLTIKTAEGDTVTLTSHTQVESMKAKLTYGPNDAPAGTATGTATTPPKVEGRDHAGDEDDNQGVTTAKLREIKLDQNVTLSVQGDLSEQELDDIKKLVSRLGSELNQLGFGERGHDGDHGDDARAGNTSLQRIDTSNLGSLSSFDLHVERTLEVTKIHVVRLPDAPPPTATPAVNSVPGKGTIQTLPQAAPAAPAAPAKPKAKAKPATTPPAPAPSAAPQPNWKVDAFHAKVSTVADMLFQRSQGTTSGLPGTGTTLPPTEAERARP